MAAPRVEHELHHRRWSRNLGLGLLLAALVALVFGLTVVKVQQGDMMQGYDHQSRASALPREELPREATPDPKAPPAAQQVQP